MGWPEQTPELKRYYPTSVLVTGFDILFFWVARMMMAGLFTQDEVPFRDVFIHGLVRDQDNKKMSKTTGNVIDPLDVIDTYGADALRFAMAALASGGRDIKLSAQRIESYRNFATKLWNSARFAEINGCERVEGFDPRTVSSSLNKWVLGELSKTGEAVTRSLEAYRFNEAASAIYRLVWNTFCDWFVELSKPKLFVASWVDEILTEAVILKIGERPLLEILVHIRQVLKEKLSEAKTLEYLGLTEKRDSLFFAELINGINNAPSVADYIEELSQSRATTAFVIDELAKLLHPFMPFITEELWTIKGEQGPAREAMLCLTRWPSDTGLYDAAAATEINRLIELIAAIRSARSEMNVPPGSQIPIVFVDASEASRRHWLRWSDALRRLARLSDIGFADYAPPHSMQLVLDGKVVALPLAGIIDLDAERARLAKEQQRLMGEIAKVDTKLANADFVSRAPAEIIEENRERKSEAEQRIGRIAEALNQLG